MNPDTFFDNFALLTDAPNAIAKLRKMVLQLAVSGKLVLQDINDESASILLAKIKAEKEQLIRSGKNGKSKLPNLRAEENFYNLPKTWKWASLEDITLTITDGEHATPPRIIEAKIPLGTAKNIRDGFLDFRITDYVSFEVAEKCWRRCKPQHNDILMVCVGATTGRLCLLKEPHDFVIVRSVALIRPFENYIYPEYVALAMKSPCIQTQVWGNVKQSAQPCLYINKMQRLYIPVPPIAEQKRIVEKCDRLLILCDEIEKRQQQRQESLLKMNEGAISQLLTAQNPDDFHHHWQRICNNFDLLYSIPETIPKLRQVILQLAIQGKLIPQNSNDEPASIILAKLQSEKERLIRERVIQKAKVSGIPSREEVPFNIPINWEWRKADDLCFVTKLAGFEYTDCFKLSDGGEVPVVRAQNVRMAKIDDRNLLYIDLETSLKLERSALTKPAILMTFIGAGIGDVAIIDPNKRWHLAPNVAKLEPFNNDSENLDINYLLLFLMSDLGRKEIFKHRKSTAQPSLSMGTIRDINVAIPPFAEQKRIVAKVDSLLSLCDALEAKLKATRDSSATLMEVAARQMVEAGL